MEICKPLREKNRKVMSKILTFEDSYINCSLYRAVVELMWMKWISYYFKS